MYNKYPDRIHNNKKLLARRRYLRRHATPEESLLWEKLKGSALGYKFRRQHSIGGYIVDFYCLSKQLVVELDGDQHNDNTDYDAAREYFMKGFNIRTIRFMNSEIRNNLGQVLDTIKKHLT